MGLYSTVYSSFDKLGVNGIGEFQTKDLESLMEEYWLSPKRRTVFLELFGLLSSFCKRFSQKFP